MTNTSTHTGICQACGRRQAVHVKTGNLAKHGYTTEYGFFNGTCQGSDHLPLEQDTKVNTAVVAGLRKWADERDAEALADITKVSVQVCSKTIGGHRVGEFKMMGRAEFEATQPRYVKFDDEVERARARLRNAAADARGHATQLEVLRDAVHGRPLNERPVETPIQRETYNTYHAAATRVAELKAAGHKAQQRREQWSRKYIVTYR